MILVSITIPTFNRAKYLKLAVDSLVNQNFPPDKYEVMIIDNGSTDDTKEISDSAIAAHPNHHIRYIYEQIPGLLSGRHRGALEAMGDILVFADDDIEVAPNWLSAIYEMFKDPKVHLVGGKNLPKYEDEPPLWLKCMWSATPYRGKACGYLSLLDLGDEVKEIDPNYVWGLNFSIRKKTLFELGGFHPDCIPKHLQRFQGDGETGLTIKIKEKGYKAIYQPRALVYHVIPSERMTVSYFESRMFYQGVCDSFSKIRREGGLFQELNDSFDSKKYFIRLRTTLTLTFRNPFKLIKIIFDKVLFRYRKEIKSILEKMSQAYTEGYQFHRNEVQNDPKLLHWVLKKDYFDYRLPE